MCVHPGGTSGVAALPQEKVGAAAEAEEGEEEEEEAAGWRSPVYRGRSDQRWTHHRAGQLPPQNSAKHPRHAVANSAGGVNFPDHPQTLAPVVLMEGFVVVRLQKPVVLDSISCGQ